MIHFSLSIYNRGEHFKLLVQDYNKLYEKNKDFKIHITDFSSTDMDIEEEAKKLKCQYTYHRLKCQFNLGIGHNNNIDDPSISLNEVVVIHANDLIVPDNIIDLVTKYTKKNISYYQPIHGMLDEKGRVHFAGGSCLTSIYKEDFLNIGKYPQTTAWGCDDDDFMYRASKQLKLNRYEEQNIIVRFHERSMNDPWYRDSYILKQRGYLQNCPPWWKLVN